MESLTQSLLMMFLVSFVGTMGAIAVLKSLSWLSQDWQRIETDRNETRPRFYRLGGVALLVGFLCAFFWDERLIMTATLLTLIGGGCLALIFGLIDDIRPLHWSIQLTGQVLLGGLLVTTGMTIQEIHVSEHIVFTLSVLPGLATLVTLFWVVLVMNAINWIDGADGVMGLVSLIALLTLGVLSLRPEVNQPTLALIIMMLSGAIVGFLIFNWQPAALIAGSGGVALLGFAIAGLAVYAGAKVATAFLVLTVPVLDASSVVLWRLRHGLSPFLPDRGHLHHQLLLLGWSPQRIALWYGAVTSLMGILALSTRSLGKVWVFGIAAIIFASLVILIQKLLTQRQSL